ncbi:hypothetical protein [Methylobacterium sp. NFXW15]|uniref:hypothetical protein n=1 Tax=Methylobacterium sp. NFXW15 TaxID=2819512 RepID=UPI003CEFECB0
MSVVQGEDAAFLKTMGEQSVRVLSKDGYDTTFRMRIPNTFRAVTPATREKAASYTYGTAEKVTSSFTISLAVGWDAPSWMRLIKEQAITRVDEEHIAENAFYLAGPHKTLSGKRFIVYGERTGECARCTVVVQIATDDEPSKTRYWTKFLNYARRSGVVVRIEQSSFNDRRVGDTYASNPDMRAGDPGVAAETLAGIMMWEASTPARNEQEHIYDACQANWDRADLSAKAASGSVAMFGGKAASGYRCWWGSGYANQAAALDAVKASCHAGGVRDCHVVAWDRGVREWVAQQARRALADRDAEYRRDENARLNGFNANRVLATSSTGWRSPSQGIYDSCVDIWNLQGYRSKDNYKAIAGGIVGDRGQCFSVWGRASQNEATADAERNCAQAGVSDCYRFALGNRLSDWVLEEEGRVDRRGSGGSGDVSSFLGGLLSIGSAALQGYAAGHGGGFSGGGASGGTRSCPPGSYAASNGYGTAFSCHPYAAGAPTGNAPSNRSGISGGR